MSWGTTFPYTNDMDQCGICDKRVRRATVLGHYLVGHRGAIAYPVCAQCAPMAMHGLPPALLKELDEKMERRATECGLTQTQ